MKKNESQFAIRAVGISEIVKVLGNDSLDEIHVPETHKRSGLVIPIHLFARDGVTRRGEPVTCGLPWPRGAVRSISEFELFEPNGTSATLQSRVLDRWSDGSIRWCLFDFLATTGTEDGYEIRTVTKSSIGDPGTSSPASSAMEIDTGKAAIRAGNGTAAKPSLVSGRPADARNPSDVTVKIVLARDGKPDEILTPNFTAEWIEHGPIRWRANFQSDPLPDGLMAFGFIDAFSESPVVRVHFTLRNSNAAGHPGGNWDLGNAGSAYIRCLEISISLPPSDGTTQVGYSTESGMTLEYFDGPLELYQDSSGGENWNSRNHINRHRKIPLRFRGYSMSVGDQVRNGLRATPVVFAERDGRMVGVTMDRFWENFPKAVEVREDRVVLSLFPKQSSDVHELQGGEQKTHVFHVAFDRDDVTDLPLGWGRSPLLAHADPEWYSKSGAIPGLTPKSTDPNVDYLALVDQAIEGSDTFFLKREKIDEYGWRHFGDVYADHEASYHKGPDPLVSHYNNQFDVVFGCGVQFLRSADPRWWDLLIPAADHTSDIDVYHSDRDKAAYNRGLFWPTFHYNDADTGTHRTYPKSLRSAKSLFPGRDLESMGETGATLNQLYAGGAGGGPSASHNYNLGLMLAHFLTGNPTYRETAIDLARFVVAMDAPRAILRPLSGEYTGLATASGGDDYHGPGRASGNSIHALVVGHRLTGDRSLLEKAEQLIRRSSHPEQELESLDLLNAELRWFYTMHLQAIGQYLDHKEELGERDRMYEYARLTLLHYARWMAKHERPILDTPERLQYPTESWAAQDMRKVEVFQFAAKHARGDERTQFLTKAQWFFDYVPRKLNEFETKSLCRPVVLMLNFGWSRNWWRMNPDASAPEPQVSKSADDFGEWRMFVPQKVIAIRRAKRIVALGAVAGVLLVLAFIWNYLT